MATPRVGSGLMGSLVPRGAGCLSSQEPPALSVAPLRRIGRNAPCTPWLPTPSPQAGGLRVGWQWQQYYRAGMKQVFRVKRAPPVSLPARAESVKPDPVSESWCTAAAGLWMHRHDSTQPLPFPLGAVLVPASSHLMTSTFALLLYCGKFTPRKI